ncbi:hypothetical protein JCM19000A_04640 [Silvimonas sp. JCM 19000]
MVCKNDAISTRCSRSLSRLSRHAHPMLRSNEATPRAKPQPFPERAKVGDAQRRRLSLASAERQLQNPVMQTVSFGF